MGFNSGFKGLIKPVLSPASKIHTAVLLVIVQQA